MSSCVLEVCVDSVDSALAAQQVGADRLMLCSNLMIGGTTPNINLFYEVRNRLDLPVSVLLRPHFGDYCYSPTEFEVMKNDVALFRDAGAESVITGMLTPQGELDVLRMDELMVMAQEMPLVLNRAFDFCRNPQDTFEQAKMMGLRGIVTSGQRRRCYDGRALIAQLVLDAAGLQIFAAGEMSAKEIPQIRKVTAARIYHLACIKEKNSPMIYRKKGLNRELSGLNEYSVWETDQEEIKKIRAALT